MNDLFLIISKGGGDSSLRLRGILENYGCSIIISDSEDSDGLWFSDSDVQSYAGLMSNAVEFPVLTAWSRALFYLNGCEKEFDGVWFVEDDVAGKSEDFRRLVQVSQNLNADLSAIDIYSKELDPCWSHWHHAIGFFEAPWRSFNPLMRVSRQLIDRVLEFRNIHDKFVFHEVMFASLAAAENMVMLDWKACEETAILFANFRWRPVVTHFSLGICHPVKIDFCHRVICEERYGNFH